MIKEEKKKQLKNKQKKPWPLYFFTIENFTFRKMVKTLFFCIHFWGYIIFLSTNNMIMFYN